MNKCTSFNFDLNEYNGSTGEFPVIEAGDYLVEINSAEILETKKKNGRYIKFSLKVISEKNKGRMIFDHINIENNDSDQAERIGRSRLKSLAIHAEILDELNARQDISILNKKIVGIHVVVEEFINSKVDYETGVVSEEKTLKNKVAYYKHPSKVKEHITDISSLNLISNNDINDEIPF